MKVLGWITAGLLVLALLGSVGYMVFVWDSYTAMNVQKQNVGKSMANIHVQLQRRSDLIPNLVKVVKGYASHEEKVFTQVTQARAQVGSLKIENPGSAEDVKKLAEAQQALSGALSRLLVVAENYPELKANQGFLDLQSQIEGTENRISVARQRYNDDAALMNTTVNGYFRRKVAQDYGFKEATLFESNPGSEKAPEVNFE